MRFILTLAVWAVTAAIVLVFFVYRSSDFVQEDAAEKVYADRDITIEITTTFSTEKDAFALDVEEKAQKAFTVSLDGKTVYETDDVIEKGHPLVLKAVKLADGAHEISVFSSPVSDGGDNAVRIKADENGISIGDKTDWFSDGQEIVSTFRFETGKKHAE